MKRITHRGEDARKFSTSQPASGNGLTIHFVFNQDADKVEATALYERYGYLFIEKVLQGNEEVTLSPSELKILLDHAKAVGLSSQLVVV